MRASRSVSRPPGRRISRRIEAGILNYGIDMTIDNNPYEIGMERLVDAAKAARLHRQGSARQDPGKGAGAPARRARDRRRPARA
jgi:glycine cleavage system aminomethyltransferase T